MLRGVATRRYCKEQVLQRASVVQSKYCNEQILQRANIVKSKIEPIEIPKLPISNFVWDHSVKNHGEKVAMVSFVI